MIPCQTWIDHGDWTGNGAFTAGDLVEARRYLCNTVGCYGSLNLWVGNHPGAAYDFAYLSLFYNGTNPDVLSDQDINIGRDFILGLIPCN